MGKCQFFAPGDDASLDAILEPGDPGLLGTMDAAIDLVALLDPMTDDPRRVPPKRSSQSGDHLHYFVTQLVILPPRSLEASRRKLFNAW